MKYIKHASEETGCIFCQKPKQKDGTKNLIFYRGNKSFALLNLYPYNSGHFMVAPYQHTAKLEKLSSETIGEMFEIINKYKNLLDKKIKPQGYNIGINMGRVAGAGIVDHLHVHVVPRWNGDTNFMPVLGGTKVMPQSLEETYEMMAQKS